MKPQVARILWVLYDTVEKWVQCAWVWVLVGIFQPVGYCDKLYQQVYIENALKRFELHDANNTKTPLPARIHLEKSEIPVPIETKTYYQPMIGTLIYTVIGTRPNIAFAAMRLS